MTERQPDRPYVYQPFGSVTHPAYDKAERLWGVGGLSPFSRITGLTKAEAEAIVAALAKLEVRHD